MGESWAIPCPAMSLEYVVMEVGEMSGGNYG